MQVTTCSRDGQPAYSGEVTGLTASPHDVQLVLDFLNTIDVEEHTDVLDNEPVWRTWLRTRGLEAAADRERVRAVRTALRGAVGDPDALHPGEVAAVVRVELNGGAPRLVAGEVIGAVLAAASRLAVLGEWERVKICPADDCRWAFFDRSRNRSRMWCSMRVCGNREKARAWRERARAH